MSNNIVTNKKHIVEIKCQTDTELIASEFIFDKQEQSLKKCGKQIRQTFKQKVELVLVQEVRELITGRYIVCAVVVLRKKSSQKCNVAYILSPSFSGSRFIALKKFTVPNTACKPNHFLLLDGPSLLVTDKHLVTVFFDSTNVPDKEKSNTFKPSGCLKVCKSCQKSIDTNIDVLHACINDNRLIIFAITSHSACCVDHQSSSKEFVIIQHHNGCFSELDGSFFIPMEYASSLTCICVQHLVHKNENVYSSKLCIGTSLGYVVTLQNGRIDNCIQLKAGHRISSISLYRATNFSQDETLLCMVDSSIIHLNGKLKVKKTIPGVSGILIGDIQDDGGRLVLLRRDDHMPPVSWVLSDFDGIHLTSDAVGPLAEEKNDGIRSCLQTVAQALHQKLQARRIDISARTQVIQQRKLFLKYMVEKHQHMNAGKQIEYSQHTPQHRVYPLALVSLVSGKTTQNAAVQGMNEESSHLASQGRQLPVMSGQSCLPVVVDRLWQRTDEESWCIGVDFVYKETRPFKAWLSLLPIEPLKCVESRSQPVYCSLEYDSSNHGQQGDHMSGIQMGIKSEERRLTVTCVTSLPAFSRSPDCSVKVFFCFQFLPPDTLQSPILESLQTKKARTNTYNFKGCSSKLNNESMTNAAFVDNVCVLVKDLMMDRYCLNLHTKMDSLFSHTEAEDIQRSVNAWQQIHQASKLVIMASPIILLQLPELLTNRCGLTMNQHLKCYISDHQVLQHIGLWLEPLTFNKHRCITVYTRTNKPQDLFRLIHHLYTNLPEPTLILPGAIVSNDIQSTCLPTIHLEVNFLSHGLTALINHAQSDMKVDEDPQTDDVKLVGDNFKRKREAMMKRQDKCVDADGIHELYSALQVLQDKTDMQISSVFC